MIYGIARLAGAGLMYAKEQLVRGVGMVFISYKSEEFKQALAVRQALETAGISCWMAPDSIAPGSEYGQAITDAIRNCDALVLVLTEAAQTSTPVLSEVDLAITFKKTVIPFHLDNSMLNDAFLFRIGIFQRIEAEGRLEAAYGDLVTRVREVLAEPSAPGAPDPVQVGLSPEEAALRRRHFLVHAALSGISALAFLIGAVLDPHAEQAYTYIAMFLLLTELNNAATAFYHYWLPWESDENGMPKRRRLSPVLAVGLPVATIALMILNQYTNSRCSGLASNIPLVVFVLVTMLDLMVLSFVLCSRSARMARLRGIRPDGSPAPHGTALIQTIVAAVVIALMTCMYLLGDTSFVLAPSLFLLVIFLLQTCRLLAPLANKLVTLGEGIWDRTHKSASQEE